MYCQINRLSYPLFQGEKRLVAPNDALTPSIQPNQPNGPNLGSQQTVYVSCHKNEFTSLVLRLAKRPPTATAMSVGDCAAGHHDEAPSRSRPAVSRQ